MKTFVLAISLLAAALVQPSWQILDLDEEDAKAAEILAQISSIIRRKHNVTRPAMTPSLTPEMADRNNQLDDIRYTAAQAMEVLESLKGNGKQKRIQPDKKWELPIRYALSSLYSYSDKEIIREAIQTWVDNTCIEFQEYASKKKFKYLPGLDISPGSGCWSYVGNIHTRPQGLSVGFGCLTVGIAMHELGHALGNWHEQNRIDRDDYVTIDYSNILSGKESNFAIKTNDISYGTSYDFSSIMHYDSLAFSIDYYGKAQTIAPKDIHQITSMGQRNYLSFNDVKKVNLHYNCIEARCSATPLAQPCENGGYQDPNNCAKCKCPPGRGGDFCEEAAAPVGTAECGGDIQVPACSSITLTSPDHPSSYTKGTACSWKVSSTGGLVFGFEKAPNMNGDTADVCQDYVEIFPSFDATEGIKFCSTGTSSGRVAEIDGGEAVVHFSGLTSDFRTGFKLYVYATCPGTTPTDLTKECKLAPTAYDYEGTEATPGSGSCAQWSGQSLFHGSSFPSGSLEEAGTACRNPNGYSSPWCFTSSTYSTTDVCTVPDCPTGAADAPMAKRSFYRRYFDDDFKYY